MSEAVYKYIYLQMCLNRQQEVVLAVTKESDMIWDSGNGCWQQAPSEIVSHVTLTKPSHRPN